MKPSARRIERLLAKVEAELACSARPRRYCFDFDEIAEAEAQGLPYVLAPRVLSRQEWIEQYSGDKGPGDGGSRATVCGRSLSRRRAAVIAVQIDKRDS
jgi:hypothetical protein